MEGSWISWLFREFLRFLGVPENSLRLTQKRPNAEPQGVPEFVHYDSGSKFYVQSHGRVLDFVDFRGFPKIFFEFLKFSRVKHKNGRMPTDKASQNLFIIASGSKYYFLSHGRVLDFIDFLRFPTKSEN